MTLRPGGWLAALDIDGTILHEDGFLSDTVRRAVRDADARGNEVMLATGRSAASTTPVLEQLGVLPRYLVCSNGAVTLERDADDASGYRRARVETFDPTEVLTTISGALSDARYAVEDAEGRFRYTARFPESAVGPGSEEVPFESLLEVEATRVVVISPNHATEEFLGVVEQMGLSRVSYAIGWTAWLDIAPDGVNKATAMEWVRGRLGVPIERTVAIGDGRNDIDMLEWAGRGVAMGQAPAEVVAAADETTREVRDDGLAKVLDTLP
ncbi:HAD family hydrolase [Amnibacterium kyonggiense]|uniref:Cof subfamily protein (Haloacid dehalogenase superfamily)/HAD superfamily hydrolase (TIGR01484 family) n=1 Tax=Amnibacterium kyonggiense TaxID=595671 RepID=A0A4R7FPU4_9MICO|nr:HAD-IIB family hydrolase [Amnibacterium kyonggiense]TDS79733.1 Cof subfamily protein (haloacid dehalogenase superfamily)/HAD superfamily hydrolase (TIGR01484 family) [Amnibacterium kyonggiense]